MQRYRNHPLWFAFLLHRLSGLALAVFLPLHFWLLGLVLTSPERLDGFLHWSDLFVVKIAEFGVVFFLAVHFFGGLRLLALEFLPWSGPRKSLVAGSIAGAFLVSGVFLLNAV